MKSDKPTKSWLEHLLSPDPPLPRKAARESLPGLTAYFWTGGVPEPHGVRDISLSGMYVFTEERWYPGTVIRMTLTDRHEPSTERSISLHATAIRWGDDGVGLKFVLGAARNQRRGEPDPSGGVDVKQLEQFLMRLRGG